MTAATTMTINELASLIEATFAPNRGDKAMLAMCGSDAIRSFAIYPNGDKPELHFRTTGEWRATVTSVTACDEDTVTVKAIDEDFMEADLEIRFAPPTTYLTLDEVRRRAAASSSGATQVTASTA